ncbi:MAG: type I 3-dehydroquinate dehydratase [Phycisphaerales bacterium]|nr:type I 3-dehydroquinate dehydratase [Phycisphaerales bacterium]
MSLIAVSIMVEDPVGVESALMAAGAAAGKGANLVEWRVDGLCEDEAGFKACRFLVEQSPLPCILTCRIEEEGGQAFGIEPDRPGLYRALASAGVMPRYVDIEAAAWRSDRELRMAVGELIQTDDCGLILSTHDFEGRPTDLARQLDVMWAEEDVSVVKVAWRARSIRDSLEAFDLLDEAAGPMIALCMDRFGVMTRVLAGKFGGLLTFASLGSDQETAPGQLALQQLRDLYRYDSISPSTKVFGILGDPVEHSLSPLLHNAGCRESGFDGVMVPMPVVEGWESFKASLACMLDHPSFNLSGMAVTSPHKQNLSRFVEESGGTLTPMVHRCGSANTLVVLPDGSLVADNTDTQGVVGPMKQVMSLKGARVAMLGAGGAARGAAIGLLLEGAEVVVFNRSEARAHELVKDVSDQMGGTVSIEYQSGGPKATDGFNAVINMTTLGMQGGPAPEASPLEALGGSVDLLNENVVVLDAVYSPLQTPFIRQALDKEAKVITGDAMFLAQAAAQFRTWTGQAAPLDAWKSLMP